MTEPHLTLYQIADAEIRSCIESYLELMRATSGLSVVTPDALQDERARIILLTGLGLPGVPVTPEEACEEWQRRQAVPFDLETGITHGVYRNIRQSGVQFLDYVEAATNRFTDFDPLFIQQNPYLLPVLQHLSGVFSKAALKKQVGAVSDSSISRPAAERLSTLLKSRVDPAAVNKGQILQRLESTLEGIVRDLVGRVLPDSTEPLAFIEVRKSSSRHASLYAKDKMFSAINWKGRNPRLLAVLVVDGEWTRETLRVMANVFDYVVPITRVTELVDTVRAYLNGDRSKLKWLVQFRITPASRTRRGSSR